MMKHFVKGTVLAAVAAVSMSMGASQAQAVTSAYLRSTVGQPWGENTNEDAMDAAFGVGNWDDLRYETVNVGTLLGGGYSFLFMEGGDDNANELEAFLGSNIGAIENYVAAGGSLLINAAPNEGDGMSYGFGGVNLVYPDFGGNPVTAVDGAHPIFNGVATAYTGTSFSHATVSGGGIAPLINDPNTNAVLAELNWGSGLVLFGGMTTTNFHDPDPDSFNLRVNILNYTAAGGQVVNGGGAVPEPITATLGLMGLGVLGMATRRRVA